MIEKGILLHDGFKQGCSIIFVLNNLRALRALRALRTPRALRALRAQ